MKCKLLIRMIVGAMVWYLTHRFVRKYNSEWNDKKDSDALLGGLTYAVRVIINGTLMDILIP